MEIQDIIEGLKSLQSDLVGQSKEVKEYKKVIDAAISTLYNHVENPHTSMTSKEALNHLFSLKDYSERLNINKPHGTHLKSMWNLGHIGIARQYSILERAGYKVVSERMWRLD